MSRIAGLLSLTLSDFQFDPQMVNNMASRQQHRGFGRPAVTNCGPLSVAVSAMPNDGAATGHIAHDPARQLWLFIDGTLFNRIALERELRTADSQALPQASPAELAMSAYRRWGGDCFSHLSGIFAIAILDRQTGKCLLATDQFGAKPLNYTVLGDHLAFASEFKPLLAMRPQPRTNLRALLEFSLHGDVMRPENVYDGIFTVPSGHYLSIARGSKPTLHRYHNPFDAVDQATYTRLDRCNPGEFLDELDALFHQSIRENMADGGPFAVALSGGVDSATLTAIAAKYGNIQAINVSVPEGRNLDERAMAERVARHIGVPLHVVTMSGELYRRELVAATLANETPLWHVQNLGYYCASRRASELGMRSILCGDTIGLMLSPASLLPWKRLHPLLSAAQAIPPSLTAFMQKLGYALGDLPLNSHGFSWYLPMAVQLIDGYTRATQHRQAEAAYAFLADTSRRQIHAGRLAEVHGFYDRFYHRGDRLGNAFGVEYRTPFGDVTALRMAMSLPYGFLVREGTPKWSIKALGSRYLPREIAFQKKAAWDMPGDIYLQPFANARFFEDGFCAETFALSRDSIATHVEHWRQEPHRLSRMVHIEIWGRLLIRDEAAGQLQERLAAFS